MKNVKAITRIESHARYLKRLIKRIVKHIKSNAWFERYQADTVELDSRITHNHAYPYFLTIVDHYVNMGLYIQSQIKKQKQLGITWLKLL